ncbi:MAG: MBL fold metallo-hydrolase [Thermoanaerobacterales bacterium]|nr:MBL fold metallo-hydrolase [Thermoanaerobacterales bacterium]
MRIEVLGCWAPYPRPDEACSGYLVSAGETRILLDCGHSVFGRLARVTDFRRLTAVFVSHFHPDHCADLPALRHAIKGALKDGSRSGRLPVYAPGAPAEDYSRLASWDDAFEVRRLEDMAGGELTVGAVRVAWVPGEHPLPGYALSCSAGGRRLVYTGDTAFREEIVAFAAGADLLLAEASGLEKDLEFLQGAHMTAAQAGETARRAQVRWLSLTHIYPEYDVGRLKAEAARALGREALAASEVRIYELEEI